MATINEWLSISETGGTGNAVITLTASTSEELTQRVASLTISGQSASAILNITQEEFNPIASFADNTVNIGYFEGEVSDVLTSNGRWYASTDDNWITVSPASGTSGNTTLTISYESNSVVSPRTGVVNIYSTVNDQLLASVTLNQAVSPAQFVSAFTTNGYNYINTNYVPTLDTEVEAEFAVNSYNDNWQAYYGCQSSDDSADTYQLRRGNGDKFAARIGDGAYTASTFTTGVTYDTVMNKNGLWVDGVKKGNFTSSALSTTLPIYIGAVNNQAQGGAWRESEITLKKFIINEDGVKVMDLRPATQDGVVVLFDLVEEEFYYPNGITPETLVFDPSGGSATVIVSSDSGWSASSVCDWITLSPSSGGSGNTVVRVVADMNGSQYNSRSCSVTIGPNTLSISQSASSHTDLPIDDYKIYYRTSDDAMIEPELDNYYEDPLSHTWSNQYGCYIIEFAHPVVKIPTYFMNEESTLKEISIPSTVAFIEEGAFHLSGLKNIYWDEDGDLREIGYIAIDGTDGIETVGPNSSSSVARMPKNLLFIHGCGMRFQDYNLTSAVFHADMQFFEYYSFGDHRSLGSIYFYGNTEPRFAPPTGGVYSATVFNNCISLSSVYAPSGATYSNVTSAATGATVYNTLTAEETFTSDVLYISNTLLGFGPDGRVENVYVYNPDSSNTLTATSSDFNNIGFSKYLDLGGNWEIWRISVSGNTTDSAITGNIVITDGITSVTIPAIQHEAVAGTFVLDSNSQKVNSYTGYTDAYYTWEYIKSISATGTSSYGKNNELTYYYNYQENDGTGHLRFEYKVYPSSSLNIRVVATDYQGNQIVQTFRIYRE